MANTVHGAIIYSDTSEQDNFLFRVSLKAVIFNAEGHVLVVPKQQAEFIWDLESVDYQALMDTVHKVGNQLREVLDAPYVGVEVIGVDVPHAHVHVVPFASAKDLHRSGSVSDEPDHSSLEKIAEKVKIN